MRTPVAAILLLTFFVQLSCKETTAEDLKSFTTAFESSNGTETATYQEVIAYYLQLAKEFPEINVQTIGTTDSGHALHLVTFNPDGNFNFQKIRQEKIVVLINNGIHPGESDGIDATMMMFRDLAQQQLDPPKDVVIATIPVYNIGGMLLRNSTTRVNQNGPAAYGFRGNARNYDLNRDFVKMDTKNAKTFASIFHLTQPDIFLDNHVSNGADYQYTLTHLFTQHNKLGGSMGAYLNEQLVPDLETRLSKEGWEITPYVNVYNRPPEDGFSQFMDYPRYSTGYTTLWNTFGLMLETHMLKPYPKRVAGTYAFMQQLLLTVAANVDNIKRLRSEAYSSNALSQYYPVSWEIDTNRVTTLNFKGFEVDTLISEVTGLQRIKYDTTRPFEKKVAYQNFFRPKDSVAVPAGYIIKRGWQNVLERLTANEVTVFEIESDTILEVEAYRIAAYDSYKRPYEGHYPHYNTKVVGTRKKIAFQKGDYYVPVQQRGMRYLLETLEPQAMDSFFNWNFFDAILQQKEGFSPYVFEDLALQILEENPNLQDSLELKKTEDQEFAQSAYAQLNWIHKQSKYYEEAHMQYPVYRVLKDSPAEALFSED